MSCCRGWQKLTWAAFVFNRLQWSHAGHATGYLKAITVSLSKNTLLQYSNTIKMASDSKLCEEKDAHFYSLPLRAGAENVASEQSCSSALAISEHAQRSNEFLPRLATNEEVRNLPHAMTSIPITAWLLVFTGSAAAFARYGVTTPFRKRFILYVPYLLI